MLLIIQHRELHKTIKYKTVYTYFSAILSKSTRIQNPSDQNPPDQNPHDQNQIELK